MSSLEGCPVRHSVGNGNNGACPLSRERSNDGPERMAFPSVADAPLQADTKMPSAECLQQVVDEAAASLSSTRETSTIPRADTKDTWQYPSPRMFYTALWRKGKPVAASSISDMLFIHNQLNEAVWGEIVVREQFLRPNAPPPRLKRFLGRPEDWSPRAWWHVRVRGGQPPFDRHDWIVERIDGESRVHDHPGEGVGSKLQPRGEEVRYVIDYYAGHPEDGQATFNVDIRPAIDGPRSLLDRFKLMFWRPGQQPQEQQQ